MKLKLRQFIFTFLLGLMVLSGMAFGGVVLAQESDVFGVDDAGFGVLEQGSGGDLKGTITLVMQWAFGFLGILAVLIILWGGYTWMTAGGDTDKVETAKKILRNGIIGLIIILTSYMIVSTIFNTFYGGGCTGDDCPPPSCTPGETRACSGNGCTGGIRTCLATGVWGGCVFSGGVCPTSPRNSLGTKKLATPDDYDIDDIPLSWSGKTSIPQTENLQPVLNGSSNSGGYSGVNFAVDNTVVNPFAYNQICDGPDCTIEDGRYGWRTADYAVDQVLKIKALGTLDGLPQVESHEYAVRVKPKHCFNNIKDANETDVDVGDGCGGGEGSPCDDQPDFAGCQADDSICGTRLTCNTTTCLCQSGPVIDYISPAKDVTGDTDFNDADTWGDDEPGAAPGNLITIWGRNFGSIVSAVVGSINFDTDQLDTLPIEWSSNEPGADDSVLVSDEMVRSGGRSLAIAAGAESTVDATLLLDDNSSYLVSGDIYRIDFYYRATTTGTLIVSVNDQSRIISNIDDSWRSESIVFQYSTGDEINFRLNGGPTGSTVYLDDLVLTKLPGYGQVTFLGGDKVAPFAFQVNAQCTDTWRNDQVVVVVPEGASDGAVKLTSVSGRSDITNDAIGPKVKDFDINDQNYPGICSVDPRKGIYPSRVDVIGLGLPTVAPQDVVWHYRAGGESRVATSSQEQNWTNTVVNDQIVENVLGATGIRVYGGNGYSNIWSFVATRGREGDLCNSMSGQSSGQCVVADVCDAGLFCDPNNCTCQVNPNKCGNGKLDTGENGENEACDFDKDQNKDVFAGGKNQCGAYGLGSGPVTCSDECAVETDKCVPDPDVLGKAKQSIYGWGFTVGITPDAFHVMQGCDRSSSCREGQRLASPAPWFEGQASQFGWTASTSPSLGITNPLACVDAIAQARFSNPVDPDTVNDQTAIVLKCNDKAGNGCVRVDVPNGSVITGDTGDGEGFIQLIPANNWDTNSWYKVLLTDGIKNNIGKPLAASPSDPARVTDGVCADLSFTDGGAPRTMTDNKLDNGKAVTYCWNFKTRPTDKVCNIGCIDCTPNPTRSFWSGQVQSNVITPDSDDNVCIAIRSYNTNWTWEEREYVGPPFGDEDYNTKPWVNWAPFHWPIAKSVAFMELLSVDDLFSTRRSVAWRETIFGKPDYVRLNSTERSSGKYGFCPAINDFTNPIVVEDRDCRQGNIQSPSPWKGSEDACINAGIAARFSRSMVNWSISFGADYNQSNVVVEKCTNFDANDNCTDWTVVNDDLFSEGARLEVFKYGHRIEQLESSGLTDEERSILEAYPSPEGFVINNLPDLTKNTLYRVVLKGGPDGVRGSAATTTDPGTPKDKSDDYLEEIDNDPYGLLLMPDGVDRIDYNGDSHDDYFWTFTTVDSDERCAVDSVNVSPSRNYMRNLDETDSYSAFPQAANCNVLDPVDYDWNWRSLIALADDANNDNEGSVNSCELLDGFSANQGSGSSIADFQSIDSERLCRNWRVDVTGRADGFTNIQARAMSTRPADSTDWHQDKVGHGELWVRNYGQLAVISHKPVDTIQCTNANVVADFNANIKSASAFNNLDVYKCPAIPADATPELRAELEVCAVADSERVDDLQWIYPITDGTTIVPQLVQKIVASSTWDAGVKYRVLLKGGAGGVVSSDDDQLGNLNYRLSTGNGEECEADLLPWREVPNSCLNNLTNRCLLNPAADLCGTELAQCTPPTVSEVDGDDGEFSEAQTDEECFELSGGQARLCRPVNTGVVIEYTLTAEQGGNHRLNIVTSNEDNSTVGSATQINHDLTVSIIGQGKNERHTRNIPAVGPGDRITTPIDINLPGAGVYNVTVSWTNDYFDDRGTPDDTSDDIDSNLVIYSLDLEDNNVCNNTCHNLGSSAAPICGNDVVETGEDCDGGASCSATCLWQGSTSCGNAIIDSGEQCDDGGNANGDGCSDRCLYEAGYHNLFFAGQLNDNKISTTTVIIRPAGNLVDRAMTCNGGRTPAGEICVQLTEACDDNNNTNGDGCSANLLNEGSTARPAQCGNGELEFGESCDDGNATTGDGCSQICLNEGSTGDAVCGNGSVESGQNDSYSWTFETAPDADQCDVVSFDGNRCPNGIRRVTFDQGVEGAIVSFFKGSETNSGGCESVDPVSFWRKAIDRIKTFVRRMIGVKVATAVNFWCPVTDDLTLSTNDFYAIDSDLFVRDLGTATTNVNDDFEIIGYRLPDGNRQISYVRSDAAANFDLETQYRFKIEYAQHGVPLDVANFPPAVSTLTTLKNICPLSDVVVNVWPAGEDKRRDNFFCSGDNCGAKTKDVYDDDQADNQVGNQHIYRAWALGNAATAEAPQLYPIKVPNANWSWNLENLGLESVKPISDIIQSDHKGDKWITAGDKQGMSELTVSAGAIPGGSEAASAVIAIQTYFCTNPWPEPRAFPFYDTCRAGDTSCINTNFSTYYCRDQGVEGDLSDDLPPIGNYDHETGKLGVVTTTPGQIGVPIDYSTYEGMVDGSGTSNSTAGQFDIPSNTMTQWATGNNGEYYLLYEKNVTTAGNYNLFITTSNDDESLTNSGYYRTHDIDVYVAKGVTTTVTSNEYKGLIKPLAVSPALKNQSVVQLGQLEEGVYTIALKWKNDFCIQADADGGLCPAPEGVPTADSNLQVHSVGFAQNQSNLTDYRVLKEMLLPYDYSDQFDNVVGNGRLDAKFALPTEGRFGQGFYLSGNLNSSYIDLATSTLSTAQFVLPPSEGTISFWANIKNVRSGYLFKAVKGLGDELNIKTVNVNSVGGSETNRFRFKAQAGSNTLDLSAGASFAADQWYNLVLTYDANNLKLYVNGSLVASKSQNNPLANPSAGWTQARLGASTAEGEKFATSFDDIRIYSDTLSEAQIIGLAKGESNPERDLALAAHYPMDNGTPDAVGIRVMTNPQHRSPLSWYQLAFARDRQGSPGVSIVDGYQAVREGRTTYIGGTDLGLIGAGATSKLKSFGTVYAASHTDNPTESTLNIYNQLLANWKLNAGTSTVDKTALIRSGRCSQQIGQRCENVDGIGRLHLIVQEGSRNKLYVREGGYWLDRSETLFGQGDTYISPNAIITGAWYFSRRGDENISNRIEIGTRPATGSYGYNVFRPFSGKWGTASYSGLTPNSIALRAGWYMPGVANAAGNPGNTDRLKILAADGSMMRLYERTFAANNTTDDTLAPANIGGLPSGGAGLVQFSSAAGWYYNNAEQIIAVSGGVLKYYTRTTGNWEDKTVDHIGGADKLPNDIVPFSGTVITSGTSQIIELFAKQGSDTKRFTYRDGKWSDTTTELENIELGPNIRNMDIKAAYFSYINLCQNEDFVACLSDSDCQVVGAGQCFSEKAKLIRDTRRLADANEMDKDIAVYYAVKRCSTDHARTCADNTQCTGGGTCGNFYPRLDLGTYIAGRSFSAWPSWQETLGTTLGTTLPTDPLNQLTGCTDPYDEKTCWSAQTSRMQCPWNSSAVYGYYSYDKGNRYGLVARGEFRPSNLEFDAIQNRLFGTFSNGQMCTTYRSDMCGNGIGGGDTPGKDPGENCYTCPADNPCGSTEYCTTGGAGYSCQPIPTGGIGGDQCPFTDKNEPGYCGCGAPASDEAINSDSAQGDIIPDCADQCPNANDGLMVNGKCPCAAGEDDDSDNVCDTIDNCVNIYNPNQSNVDDDSFGDLCDDNYVVDGERLTLKVSQGGNNINLHPYATPQTAAEFYDRHSGSDNLSAIDKYEIANGDHDSAIFSHFDTIRKKLSIGFLHRDVGGVKLDFVGAPVSPVYWPQISTVSTVLDLLDGSNSGSSITWSSLIPKRIYGSLTTINNTFPSADSWSVVVTPSAWSSLNSWFVKNPNINPTGGQAGVDRGSLLTISYDASVATVEQACHNGKREGTEVCDCGTSGMDLLQTSLQTHAGAYWLCRSTNNIPPDQPYMFDETPIYWCDTAGVDPNNECGAVKARNSLYCGDNQIQNAIGANYESCEPGFNASGVPPQGYAWNGTEFDFVGSSIEKQYQCDQNICQQVGSGWCGDGILQKNVNVPTYVDAISRIESKPAEGCDDADKNSGDGCSNTCQEEDGWVCDGSDGSLSICRAAQCGDGIKVGSEVCDDGNANNEDGCSNICVVEPGFICTGVGTATSICHSDPNDGICSADEDFNIDPACPVRFGDEITMRPLAGYVPMGKWQRYLTRRTVSSSLGDFSSFGAFTPPVSSKDQLIILDASGQSVGTDIKAGDIITIQSKDAPGDYLTIDHGQISGGRGSKAYFKADCSGGCPNAWERFIWNGDGSITDWNGEKMGIDWNTEDYEVHFGGVNVGKFEICNIEGRCKGLSVPPVISISDDGICGINSSGIPETWDTDRACTLRSGSVISIKRDESGDVDPFLGVNSDGLSGPNGVNANRSVVQSHEQFPVELVNGSIGDEIRSGSLVRFKSNNPDVGGYLHYTGSDFVDGDSNGTEFQVLIIADPATSGGVISAGTKVRFTLDGRYVTVGTLGHDPIKFPELNANESDQAEFFYIYDDNGNNKVLSYAPIKTPQVAGANEINPDQSAKTGLIDGFTSSLLSVWYLVGATMARMF